MMMRKILGGLVGLLFATTAHAQFSPAWTGLVLKGTTSGSITVLPQATAGTFNFNLPITAGTAGQVLTSGGGGSAPMTWTAITGGGNVSNVGTPTNGQIAQWTGATTIQGLTLLTGANGGTGVNNGANTISTSLNFAITGSGAQTFFFGNTGVPWTYNFPQVSGNLAYQVGSITNGHALIASGTAGGIADGGAPGSSLTLTDGTHTVTGTSQITVTGGTVGGTTPNATLLISGGGTGCTPSGGSTTNIVLYGTSGACAPATSANITAGALTLGTASSIGGSVVLEGSTSGAATLTGGTAGVFTSSSAFALSGVVTLTGGSTALGTPASLVGTNITGTAAGLTAGIATTSNGLNSATTTVSVSAATAPTTGQVLTATSGTAATWQTLSASATSITPGTTTIVGSTSPCLIENSTSTTMACPAVTTGAVTAFGIAPNASGGFLTTAAPDGTSIIFGSGHISTTFTATVHTSSASTVNIGGEDDYSGSSLTATLATLTSGQSLVVTDQNASALTVALASQTVVGLPLATTLHTGGFYSFTYNGSTLSGFGNPGYGTITTGALTKFIDGSGALTAASAADIPATPLATGTTVSLAGPRQYYACTGTCTVTPPTPSAGLEFCVFNDDNVSTVITLAALGGSIQYETAARTGYGTAGTGTLHSGGAAADKVCIVGKDATHYYTISTNGTWTAT